MTRKERHDEVVSLAAHFGLDAKRTDNNTWHIWGEGRYCGTLSYNQRNGVWKVLCVGGQAHFGKLGELLNLLACTYDG